ncbi:MAG TPA: hypothetical protein VJT14_16810 [Candidatus Dormibacteraeota bacterium]|nr:hypothetical protein [Candidatus Dormibacteraeota bacterium]
MPRRELALLVGGALVGAWFGALFSAGAAGKAFAPAGWFWPVAYACLILGALLVIAVVIAGFRDIRFHGSVPLELIFEGPGTPCVELHHETREVKSVPDGKGTFTVSGRLVVSAATVRLHLRNLRSRNLSQVTVRVVRVTVPDGTDVTQNYFLRWMHDPQPTYPASHAGISCRPGLEAHAYIDVAHKRVDRQDISILFASDTLAGCVYTATELGLDFEVQSRDEQSNTPAPTVRERYKLSVVNNGLVTLARRG